LAYKNLYGLSLGKIGEVVGYITLNKERNDAKSNFLLAWEENTTALLIHANSSLVVS